MSIVSKASLKNDFLTDKVITEDKMEDLIDSCYNGGFGQSLQFDRTFTTDELINMDYGTPVDPYAGIEILPPPGPGKFYAKRAVQVVYIYKYDGDVFGVLPNSQIRIYWPEGGPAGGGAPGNEAVSSVGLIPVFGGESLAMATSLENTAMLTDWNMGSQDQSISAPGFINQPWYIGSNQPLTRNSPATNGTIHVRFNYSIVDLSDIW
tara:strand:+ start:487 stop:1107 length:621 start_codon:yes stop_codon:yes gene_type:complete